VWVNLVSQPALEEPTDVDLAGIVRLLWRRKVLVILCTVVAGSIALAIALTSKPYFKAEVVVTEVRDRGLGGIGALAAQFGGLASLAGMNLNGGPSGSDQKSAAILDSNHLAEEFIRRYNLIPVLLKRSKVPATMWKAVKAFKEGVVTIRKDTRKGVTIVQVEWTDPATAALWANEFVALANEIIRQQVLTESARNIAYLDEQLAQTNDLELRKVMYDIIETETKTVMLAKGRTDYAFQVVDPAVAPELKDRPHRSIIVLMGLILGSAAGAALAWLLERLRRAKKLAV
jgi:uncharacterized protein involved in exopolysaccharide biosynthesis